MLLSIASVWEIGIKVGLGRLPMPLPLEVFLTEPVGDESGQRAAL